MRLKAVYLAKFPDGVTRESWPAITYFRARPSWIRYSDFSGESPTVLEIDLVGAARIEAHLK